MVKADKNKQYSFALIAIVAIVAIVGIVMMFMNSQPGVYTTDQGLNLESAEQTSLVGQAATATCTDSDLGKDYYTYGFVTYKSTQYPDVCSGSYILEKYCYIDATTGKLVQGSEKYLCPNGCSNRKCTPASDCVDTDGGKNYDVKGITNWYFNNQWWSSIDYCMNEYQRRYNVTETDFRLAEHYCPGGAVTYYTCPYGCADGACLNKVLQITNLGSVTNLNVGGRLDYGDISKIRGYAQQGKRFKIYAIISHYPSNAKYALSGEPNMTFDCPTYTYAPATATPYGGWITCTKKRQTIYSNYSAYTEADLWFMIPIASSYNGEAVLAGTKLYRNGIYKIDEILFVNYAEVYTY